MDYRDTHFKGRTEVGSGLFLSSADPDAAKEEELKEKYWRCHWPPHRQRCQARHAATVRILKLGRSPRESKEMLTQVPTFEQVKLKASVPDHQYTNGHWGEMGRSDLP